MHAPFSRELILNSRGQRKCLFTVWLLEHFSLKSLHLVLISVIFLSYLWFFVIKLDQPLDVRKDLETKCRESLDNIFKVFCAVLCPSCGRILVRFLECFVDKNHEFQYQSESCKQDYFRSSERYCTNSVLSNSLVHFDVQAIIARGRPTVKLISPGFELISALTLILFTFCISLARGRRNLRTKNR